MAKNNKELKEMIADMVMDEDELNYIIVLEGDEFAGGAKLFSFINLNNYSRKL